MSIIVEAVLKFRCARHAVIEAASSTSTVSFPSDRVESPLRIYFAPFQMVQRGTQRRGKQELLRVVR